MYRLGGEKELYLLREEVSLRRGEVSARRCLTVEDEGDNFSLFKGLPFHFRDRLDIDQIFSAEEERQLSHVKLGEDHPIIGFKEVAEVLREGV